MPPQRGFIKALLESLPLFRIPCWSVIVETAKKRKLALKVVKLETLEQAQSSPTPATIFSLFIDGRFVTTDLSVCMDSRFDKLSKANEHTHHSTGRRAIKPRIAGEFNRSLRLRCRSAPRLADSLRMILPLGPANEQGKIQSSPFFLLFPL